MGFEICCFCYLVTKSCPTLGDPKDCSPARILCSWDFSGKNTGVGCHFLLQGIFLTQGSNPVLTDSFEKILMLGEIEGGRRKG